MTQAIQYSRDNFAVARQRLHHRLGENEHNVNNLKRQLLAARSVAPKQWNIFSPLSGIRSVCNATGTLLKNVCSALVSAFQQATAGKKPPSRAARVDEILMAADCRARNWKPRPGHTALAPAMIGPLPASARQIATAAKPEPSRATARSAFDVLVGKMPTVTNDAIGRATHRDSEAAPRSMRRDNKIARELASVNNMKAQVKNSQSRRLNERDRNVTAFLTERGLKKLEHLPPPPRSALY